MTLNQKLESFNIPAKRRELNLDNILWLGRNLPLNNGDNPLLKEVMLELKGIARKELKKLNVY